MTTATLRHPLVASSILLFIVHQIIERGYGYSIPIVHAYLDDLLCMPIILGLAMQFIQWIHPLKELYHLDKIAIAISVIFYSILFEIILPMASPSTYTADWIDVLLYSTGALLFYCLISRKIRVQYSQLIKNL